MAKEGNKIKIILKYNSKGQQAFTKLSYLVTGDSWYVRLLSNLQGSLRNESKFVNHLNFLYENELVGVHCLQ